jgi:hypothetical protein
LKEDDEMEQTRIARVQMETAEMPELAGANGLLPIDPDAHATGELDYVPCGVTMARKGWVGPGQTLNARSPDAVVAWLERRRAVRSRSPWIAPRDRIPVPRRRRRESDCT